MPALSGDESLGLVADVRWRLNTWSSAVAKFRASCRTMSHPDCWSDRRRSPWPASSLRSHDELRVAEVRVELQDQVRATGLGGSPGNASIELVYTLLNRVIALLTCGCPAQVQLPHRRELAAVRPNVALTWT
jgi:hypothetical protein